MMQGIIELKLKGQSNLEMVSKKFRRLCKIFNAKN